MATRIYLPSSGAPAVTPSSWNHANQAGTTYTLPGVMQKGTTALTSRTTASGTVSPYTRAVMRYIIGPLDAQQIAGTVNAVLRASEANSGANATMSIAVKIIQPGGTDRAVLLAATASDSATSPYEFATTIATRRAFNASEERPISLTAQNATAGDYLVIEIGFRSATTTTRNVVLRHGDNAATDLADADGDTASGDVAPWVEFSQDIAWQMSLPTVTTEAASDVMDDTATGNGTITDRGGPGLCDVRGFVYGKTSVPNDPGNVAPASSGYTSYAEDSGAFGTGAFTKALTGLDPSSTYYIRAYTHNSAGYSYGDEETFNTQSSVVLPTVTTEAASSVAEESATLNGTITNTGGENCDERGFVADTQSRSLPGNVAPSSSGYANYGGESGSFGAVSFAAPYTDIAPLTTYYVRAYAHNSAGYSYGDEVNFTTLNWAVRLKASSYIPAGGTTATTRQLTIPSGKVEADYEAGKITDDTNPLASFDPGSAKFSEWEVSIEIDPALVGNGDEIEVWLTNNGTDLPGGYNAKALWTIGSAAAQFAASVSATAVASAALTTDITVASAVSGVGTAAGALTSAIQCAASVLASATVAGSLTTAIQLGTAIQGAATVAGALTTEIPLGGAVQGAATVVADLTVPWTVRLKASDYIPTGGTTATTALLTPPTGKTTADFEAGKITDDTNPLASFDPGSGKYSEWEVCVEVNADELGNGDEIEILLMNGDTELDGYDHVATWTIGTPPAQFAASVSATAVASAALTTDITVASAVSGVGTAAGALTSAIQCAASVLASVTVAAPLTTGIPLGSAIPASATVAGALTTAIPMAGSVEGTASAQASLSAGEALFEASVSGTASTAGALTTAITLATVVAGAGTVSAGITTDILLAAACQAAGTVAAALTIPGISDVPFQDEDVAWQDTDVVWGEQTAVTMAAAVSGTVTVAAALTTGIPLAGAPAATGALSGSLITAIPLAGAAQGSGTLAGAVNTAIVMAGAVQGTGALAGALTTAITLAGAIAGAATVEGDLQDSVQFIDASVEGAGSAAGALTTAILVAGAVSGTAAAAADLLAGAGVPLEASAEGAGSVAASLTTQIQMGAAVQVTGTAAGAVTTGIPLATSVTGSATATAALTTAIQAWAAVSGVASGAGALLTGIRMGVAGQGMANVLADLLTGLECASSVAGVGSTVAALNTGITMAGGIFGRGTIAGDLMGGEPAVVGSPYTVVFRRRRRS